MPLPRPLRRTVGGVARRLGVTSAERARREVARAQQQRDEARRRAAAARAARDSQRERADALAAELDKQRRSAVRAGRERPGLGYVVVVTYGRSGSTLLQGILSATPGVVVRGENGGVLQHLFAFHDTVTRHRDRLRRRDVLPPTHPWYGVDGYPDATALRDIRSLLVDTVLRPDDDTTLVGFKEIDWPAERLDELLAFVRLVLPGVKFVLNTRDLEQVAVSKWWADRPDALGQLQAMEQRLVEALTSLGDDAWRRVHYDDWVSDPDRLRELFDWLGIPFDEARVRAVLDVPHSY